MKRRYLVISMNKEGVIPYFCNVIVGSVVFHLPFIQSLTY